MKTSLLCGLLACWLACAGGALAYANLLGPTGIAAVPSAAVAAPGTVTSTFDYVNNKEFSGSDVYYATRLLYGIDGDAEAGLGYMSASHPNKFSVNAKKSYLIGDTRWAIGGSLEQDTRKVVGNINWAQDNLYVVATRDLLPQSEALSLAGTAGLQWRGLFAAPYGGVVDGLYYFLGVEAVFPQLHQLSLGVDYLPKVTKLGWTSAVETGMLRYPCSHVAAVEIGLQHVMEHNHYFLGFNYTYSEETR